MSEERLLRHGSSTLLADLGVSLTTKAGSLFALCGASGDIDTDAMRGLGIYFHDTRFLSRSTLRLNGRGLAVLLSSAKQGDRSLCELTNPQLELADGTRLSKERIGIRRERRLGRRVVETIQVTSHAARAVVLSLEVELDADFETMWVVRGADLGRRGTRHEPRWDGDELTFRYDGADGRTRTTVVHVDPPPDGTGPGGHASFAVSLEPGKHATLKLTITVRDEGSGELEQAPSPPRPAELGFGELTVETDNELFDRVLARSFDDLRMLAMREGGDSFFAAGVPWFCALFGRDSLVTALQTLAFSPRVAANTLQLLAKYQGRTHDEWRDEEPGKILHELRVDEKANLHEVPQTPYYGSVDATPLFVVLLAEYVRWSGDLELWRQLRPHVERALEWLDGDADHDGDGFVDYVSKSDKGLANQGWKDSGNSITNRDGTMVEPPVALVEVQGYAYRAKLDAAFLFRADGEGSRAAELEDGAEALRKRFRQAYWVPDRTFLAVALGAGGEAASSLASNAGQALWSGIVSHSHARAVARELIGDRFFSGWGIRTLAEGETAYNPIDYQVGAVWPHDNSLIAAGLRRYGYASEANSVFGAIFEAAAEFPDYRLPEVFTGFSREQYSVPVRYPVACSPQAWAAGALPYLLVGALGLAPNALEGVLRINRPTLPDWLGEVTLRGLRVGEASVDLRYERSGGATLVALLGRRGNVDVRIDL